MDSETDFFRLWRMSSRLFSADGGSFLITCFSCLLFSSSRKLYTTRCSKWIRHLIVTWKVKQDRTTIDIWSNHEQDRSVHPRKQQGIGKTLDERKRAKEKNTDKNTVGRKKPAGDHRLTSLVSFLGKTQAFSFFSAQLRQARSWFPFSFPSSSGDNCLEWLNWDIFFFFFVGMRTKKKAKFSFLVALMEFISWSISSSHSF